MSNIAVQVIYKSKLIRLFKRIALVALGETVKCPCKNHGTVANFFGLARQTESVNSYRVRSQTLVIGRVTIF